MPLPPALADYVARAASGPPAWTIPLEDLRAGPEAETDEVWGDRPAVESIRDVVVEGRDGHELPLRLYVPEAAAGLPVLVWLHGGGWVVGSVESHDPLCRFLAATTPCAVVAPDYRLAPEHPYPAAVEDAWAALAWAAAHAGELHGDPRRLAVGGDSAGGNLAAVVARWSRDRGLPLALQVLAYPVADFHFETDSYVAHAEGLNLTRAKMEWYWGQYLAGADGLHPDASPLRAERLEGLAPALVQTAEYDVLRSEGELYAERLRAAGVETVLTRYGDVIHGFLRMPALTPAAREGLDEIAAALRAT